jgi:hypothetical protein
MLFSFFRTVSFSNLFICWRFCVHRSLDMLRNSTLYRCGLSLFLFFLFVDLLCRSLGSYSANILSFCSNRNIFINRIFINRVICIILNINLSLLSWKCCYILTCNNILCITITFIRLFTWRVFLSIIFLDIVAGLFRIRIKQKKIK